MFTNKLYYQLSWAFQKALENHGCLYQNSIFAVKDCDDMYCGCFFE